MSIFNQTQVLHVIQTQTQGQSLVPKILVCSRDPGSAAALLPVVTQLQKKYDLYFLTDSWAKQIFLDHLALENIPTASSLLADVVIPQPDVVLVDPSASDRGLENYVELHFKQAPLVLLEDYYGTALPALQRFAEFGVVPQRVCVMDQFAQALILKTYPQLKEKIIVTGQPAFDQLAHEDGTMQYQQVRAQLGVEADTKMVVMFGVAADSRALLRAIMEQWLQAKISQPYYFIFRAHPRDQIKQTEYDAIVTQAGLQTRSTLDYTADEMNLAADVVMTTTSIQGLYGVYHRKPTIHILDRQYGGYSQNMIADYVPPPCQCGASLAVSDLTKLSTMIPALMTADSTVYQDLQKNMAKYYMLDGQNTARVLQVVDQLLIPR